MSGSVTPTDAPALWGELLALAGREASDRAYLERLLDAWCREHGAAAVALYLEGERGAELQAQCGPHSFPSTLADPSAAGLAALRLPAGMLVWPAGLVAPPSAGALHLLLTSAAAALRLKRQYQLQRFQANYKGVELEALYEVGLAIASTLNLEELSEVILLRAVALLDASRGALYLLEDGSYRLARSIGGDAIAELPAADPRVRGLIEGSGAGAELLPGVTHLLGVAIAIDGSPRGLLLVADKERRGGVGPFPAADRRTLGLFANQAAIALENARLHLQALEKERLERDMQLASDIQRRILPKGSPEVAGYEVEGWSRPARQVGGDYYDFLPLSGGRLGLTVGDVSGKGMPAALLVSTLHSAMRLLLDSIEVGPSFLARLNRHIVDSSAPNKFITLFVAELDPLDGRVRYLNAGHNPAVLVRSDGSASTLGPGGLPLGLLPGATYRGEALEMFPGDLLCLYSDGITEASPPSDEEFGIDRLIELLRGARELPLSQIVAAVDRAVTEYAEGQPQGDDQTLVLLRRTPAARP